MKPAASMIIVAFCAALAMASPAQKRQNDVPACEDGSGGPVGPYTELGSCSADCFGTEQADNGNKGGICAGSCDANNICGTTCFLQYLCTIP